MASTVRFSTYFISVKDRRAGSHVYISKVAMAILGNPDALDINGDLKTGMVIRPAPLALSDAGRIERGGTARRVIDTSGDWQFVQDSWRLTGLDDAFMARTKEPYELSVAVTKEQITVAPMDLSQGDRLTREVHPRTKGRQQSRRTAAIREAHAARKAGGETAPRPAQPVARASGNPTVSVTAMHDAMQIINAAVSSGFKLARNADGAYRLVIE